MQGGVPDRGAGVRRGAGYEGYCRVGFPTVRVQFRVTNHIALSSPWRRGGGRLDLFMISPCFFTFAADTS
jgi:hypothetical protein